MLYALFVFYFLCCCYYLTKFAFVQSAGMGYRTVLFLFSTKIMVAIIGGLVSKYLYHNQTDLYTYTQQGLKEYYNLFHHPSLFFTDSLPNAFENKWGDYFGDAHSFWNSLRNNILVKTMGVMNIFSRGSYYINSLFFNVLGFLSSIALYKVFIDIYPNQKRTVIIGCFLLPSCIYFSSLIGKDLLVAAGLYFIFYDIYFGLKDRFTAKRIGLIISSFMLILLMRNFVAVLLFPCIIVWMLHEKYKWKATFVYASFFSVIIICICVVQYLPNKYNPLQIVVNKQQAFFSGGAGYSNYTNDTLVANTNSFLKASPKALRHSFVSPYISEFSNIYLNAFAIEILCYYLLFMLMIFYSNKTTTIQNSFLIFGISFSFLIFLFIGYICPNAGSVIRYRSIYLPFFIVPIAGNIDCKRIKLLFKVK